MNSPNYSAFVCSVPWILALTFLPACLGASQNVGVTERDSTLISLSKNNTKVSQGREAYNAFCLSCHGPENVEIDSPSNLFDDKWYQHSGPSGIEKSIREGVVEKGMPAWGEMIPKEQIEALIAYLLSFQTTFYKSNE